jgi:hypothetical protein
MMYYIIFVSVRSFFSFNFTAFSIPVAMIYFINCLVLLALCGVSTVAAGRLTEAERVQQWRQTHTWPPTWQKETEQYKSNMAKRERLIQAIPGSDERWENWMQYTQQRLVPNFTDVGFKLLRTPADLQAKMFKAVQDGVDNWDNLRSEGNVNAINQRPGLSPKMVNLQEVARELHLALLPGMEEWAGGIKLKPTSAYGVRLYQNGSSLVMHNDKPFTHVISAIVHIAHEYDNDDETWPIEIEDHDGNLHQMDMEAGDMLYYESAKCLHGRMTEFKGKYYGSIFVHYQPVDLNVWNYQVEDVINAVPPHWRDGTIEDKGSRWAGQAITTDDRIAHGAPPRGVGVHNHRNKNYVPVANAPDPQQLQRTSVSAPERDL